MPNVRAGRPPVNGAQGVKQGDFTLAEPVLPMRPTRLEWIAACAGMTICSARSGFRHSRACGNPRKTTSREVPWKREIALRDEKAAPRPVPGLARAVKVMYGASLLPGDAPTSLTRFVSNARLGRALQPQSQAQGMREITLGDALTAGPLRHRARRCSRCRPGSSGSTPPAGVFPNAGRRRKSAWVRHRRRTAVHV